MKLIKKLLALVSLIFTLIGTLTFVMTYQNLGFAEGFFTQWLSSTLWSALTVAPVGFLLMMGVSKVVGLLLPSVKEAVKNMVIGISMAVIMESVMAFVTTLNNVTYASWSEFVPFWWQAFLIALPVGLIISLFMSLLVKPRLQRFMAS